MRYLVSIIALVVGVLLVGPFENKGSFAWQEHIYLWLAHAVLVVVLGLMITKFAKAPYGVNEVFGLACAIVLAMSLSTIAPIPALVTIGLAMFFFSVIVLEAEAFVGVGFALSGIAATVVLSKIGMVS